MESIHEVAVWFVWVTKILNFKICYHAVRTKKFEGVVWTQKNQRITMENGSWVNPISTQNYRTLIPKFLLAVIFRPRMGSIREKFFG